MRTTNGKWPETRWPFERKSARDIGVINLALWILDRSHNKATVTEVEKMRTLMAGDLAALDQLTSITIAEVSILPIFVSPQ